MHFFLQKLSLLVLKQKTHKITIQIIRLVNMLKLSPSDFFLVQFQKSTVVVHCFHLYRSLTNLNIHVIKSLIKTFLQ